MGPCPLVSPNPLQTLAKGSQVQIASHGRAFGAFGKREEADSPQRLSIASLEVFMCKNVYIYIYISWFATVDPSFLCGVMLKAWVLCGRILNI